MIRELIQQRRFFLCGRSGGEALLDDIVYSLDGSTAQTITATSSTVSPQGNDIYFEGHFYRYVDSGHESIGWPSAVLAAGARKTVLRDAIYRHGHHSGRKFDSPETGG
jgi:hypothetical protein